MVMRVPWTGLGGGTVGPEGQNFGGLYLGSIYVDSATDALLKFNVMQALVTGGSGFIGSEVIHQLIQQGVGVRALLRKTSPRYNLQGLDYETALGDLSDLESLKQAVKGVDYVFHLAGSIQARNRAEYFSQNCIGTGNLARACAEANPQLKRFVYVSSIAASGPSASLTPRQEFDVEAPVSIYGASKLGGERELMHWSENYPTTVVRPPAVYGPRDKSNFEFVKVINNGIVPVLSSKQRNGKKYYSVIHVEDLVRGIVLAGLAPDQGPREVFFLCGDGIYTWNELMASMAEGLGKRTLKIPVPGFALTGLGAMYTAASWLMQKNYPLSLDKLKDLRADYWICSNERAKKVLGFEPKWDLRRGMAQTISWYRLNGWV